MRKISRIVNFMNSDQENLKKSVKEHSEKLGKLGMELGEIQFMGNASSIYREWDH